MRVYDLLQKKRDGKPCSREDLKFFIHSLMSGDLKDYQASAFLMASFIQGLSKEETTFLTEAMTQSGEVLDLSSIPGLKIDKHSTGGVGDGISLVLAPLVASCGVKVPMMSGRGLGHTGGTLDKLESIPGFKTQLSIQDFIKQLNEIGVALIGQTETLAPADKKLYALRDVTGTVESIPLITASILSKKFAEGADGLLLDVKVGMGAFMKSPKEAKRLALSMTTIGKKRGKKMLGIVTDMNQPLGSAIGNALEIDQAIQVLKGHETPHLRDYIQLTIFLGGRMLHLGGLVPNSSAGEKKIRAAIQDGSGLKKFEQIVRAQGGDPKVCTDPLSVLPRATQSHSIRSPQKGFVTKLNARNVGVASLLLGAGRAKKEETIDPSAGILLHKKVGDSVEKGEIVAMLYSNRRETFQASVLEFTSGLEIGKRKPKYYKLVHGVVS